MPTTAAKVVHVAAAAIIKDEQILLALRPKHQHQGGLWEFPGGKLEPNEQPEQALVRELQEELGIQATQWQPLIQIPHHYPDKSVYLHVFVVSAYQGQPQGREGQQIQWVARNQLTDYAFPAANQPILQALQLPNYIAITPTDLSCETIAAYIEQLPAATGVQLRLKHLSESHAREIALTAKPLLASRGLPGYLNHPQLEIAQDLGLGIHLTGQQLQQAQPGTADFSASCHTPHELALAAQLGARFALLGPVQETRSHPQQTALGWPHFSQWVAEATLPVYALGGLSRAQLAQARQAGAQGVAGISAFIAPSI